MDVPLSEQKVVFEYIKSPFFRVIHADGMIGGLTPAGNLHVVFYSERPPVPQKMSHAVNADGTLGDAIPEHTKVREGIIREMDVDAVMSVQVAEALMTWLAARVAEAKALRAMQTPKESA